MKKTFLLFLPMLFLVTCGIYKTVTVDRLQLGMSRAEVEDIFGRPEKILVVSMTEHGRQEILAHKIGNDIYSLEYMNDQLVRYEFLREDVVYVPRPPLPPVVFVQEDHPPVRPRPVEHPPATKPSPPSAPLVDPGKKEQENQRPESTSRRPGSGRINQERTNERNRPATSETRRTNKDDAGMYNVSDY